MIKAVLCDLDGTLLDSNEMHAAAWQLAFEAFGVPSTFEQVVHQIGKGGDQLIPVFVAKKDLDRLEKPIEEYRKKVFHNEYFDKIKAFPDARELLQKMKSHGLRIAIASSASKEDLEKLEQIANIADLVEKETSSDDAQTSKPAPDIFQAALDRLDLKPEDCMALGDTPWDVEAAQRSRIQTVTVTCGGWTAEQLTRAGAIEVYCDPADLMRRFEQSAFARSWK